MPKIIKDITEQLAQNNKKYHEIFELNEDAILMISMKTKKVIEANMVSTKLLGCSMEKLKKIELSKLFPHFMCEQICGIKKSQSFINTKNFERILVKKYNGEEFYADVRPRNMFTGGEQVIIMVIRDVSDQRKSEEAVRNHALEIEKLNKLMIGRELKMIELKKEIKELKQKLKIK